MTATPTTWALERSGKVDLQFTGVLLAEVSTEQEGKLRWSEQRIYRTVGGSYVAERVGRSTIPTERDHRSVTVANTAEELLDQLHLVHMDGSATGRRYLPNYSMDALRQAAEIDVALGGALAERVE